jgi:hypothetical protein
MQQQQKPEETQQQNGESKPTRVVMADIYPEKTSCFDKTSSVLSDPVFLIFNSIVAIGVLVAYGCGYFESWRLDPKAFRDFSVFGNGIIESFPRSAFHGEYVMKENAQKFFLRGLFQQHLLALGACVNSPLRAPEGQYACHYLDLMAVAPLIGIVILPGIFILAICIYQCVQYIAYIPIRQRQRRRERRDNSTRSLDSPRSARSDAGLPEVDQGNILLRTFGPARPLRVYPLWYVFHDDVKIG